MSLLDKERLSVTRDEDGTVTWTLTRPLLGLPDVLPCSILAGMAAYALKSWGFAWEHAGPLGAALALVMLLVQGYVEIYQETLVWLPGKGVLLQARRRCGYKGQDRAVKLARLEGATIHEHALSWRKRRTYLALLLTQRNGEPVPEGEEGEAELAFPNLVPSPAVLRPVLEELEPLIADKDAAGKGKAAKLEPKKRK
ncbi:hypothetical protein ABPG77_007235 [Micractinium sp. CCAP 211/92]